MEKLHQEISTLNSVFKCNGYPKIFINLYIKKVLDKLFVKKSKFESPYARISVPVARYRYIFS